MLWYILTSIILLDQSHSLLLHNADSLVLSGTVSVCTTFFLSFSNWMSVQNKESKLRRNWKFQESLYLYNSSSTSLLLRGDGYFFSCSELQFSKEGIETLLPRGIFQSQLSKVWTMNNQTIGFKSHCWEDDGSFHAVCIFVIGMSLVCAIIVTMSVIRISQLVMEMYR